MNIAFSAILILLLILPGFVFSVAFYNIDHRPINYVPLTHKAVVSLFASCAFHVIWLSMLYSLNHTLSFHPLLTLIAGTQDSEYTQAIESISLDNIFGFFKYFISIYLFAFCIGKLARYLIKKMELDRFPFFRLETKWHYLFGGHDWEKGAPDGVIIAATHELAGEGYLYLGLLKDFHLDDEGNLDRLILTSVGRRNIHADKSYPQEGTKERFYPIDGDCLILKYCEIKTLNVQYLKIEDA
jgi:hypothetical protein